MVKLRRRLFLLILVFVSGLGFGQDVSEFYNQLLTINDPSSQLNNGLTVFPVLNLSNSSEEQAMAGAYTAVVRDSGFFESNPAASALLDETQFGVYHSNIIADVNLDSLTFAYRNNDLGLGAMAKLLTTSFTAYKILGDQQASSYYIESVLGINGSYALGRDYYSSGLVIGANLKIAYRSIPEELYQHVSSVKGSVQSAVGFMADIGMLTRFNFLKGYNARDKNFSIGVSIRNLGPPVLNEPLPTMATAGIAWSPLRFLLISGDFLLPINLVDLSSSESIGFATGISVQFTNFLAVKAGFGLKGGNPRFSLGTDVELEGIALSISYTLDYTTQLKIPDHMGIQARLILGDEGRSSRQKQIDNIYIDVLVALSESNYKTAIDLCTKILEIDSTFNPAQESLKLAQKNQALIDKLEEIRLDKPKLEEETQ